MHRSSERLPAILGLAVCAVLARAGLAQSSCTPRPIAPAEQAQLSQRRLDGGQVETAWHFSWEGCPGATRYHLYVTAPGAASPIVDIDTLTATSYRHRSVHYGLSVLKGWRWKVRAEVEGQWGHWSKAREFSVAPLAPAETAACRIAGRLHGLLEYSVRSRPHEPPAVQRLTHMTAETDGESQPRVVAIQGRQYRFLDLPAGKTYRIQPAGGFRSEPRQRSVFCRPSGDHRGINFTIIGAPLID